MSTANVIDEPTVEITATGQIQGGLAAELIKHAIERHLGEGRSDLLSWFLSHPASTEQLWTLLIETDPTLLAELGHRAGPLPLLHLLARHYQYPEAILTIAKRLYTEASSSVAEFQSFVGQHPDHLWMLKSLIRLTPSSEEKEKTLVAMLERHAELYHDYIEVRRSQQRQARAAIETNAEVIQELFATQDPAVLRCLATNPHTPRLLLQEMAALKGTPGARATRELAQKALHRKPTTENGHE